MTGTETVIPHARVLAYIREQAWSILPESLETIVEIASRTEKLDTEALAAKYGQRLAGTEGVELRDGVAIVNVEGPLFRYANLFTMLSGASSYAVIAQDFNAALENPAVKAIVLNINSPGGQTDGANELSSMIYQGRKRRKKKVTAYVSHLGASAAYLIASAADEIVLDAMASVGSIGTVARVYTGKEKDTMEIVSSQSPKKRPDVTTDQGRAQIQDHLDALAEVFINAVATYRGVSAETVLKDYGQGGVLVGERAVRVGMADRLGSLESVIAGMSGSTSREVTTMSDEKKVALTRAILAAEHSALLTEVLTEGATSERARIEAVLAQSLPGHEALINKLAFDGKTTGDQAAVQVLAAEKTARGEKLGKLRAEAPEPAAPSIDRVERPKEKEVKATEFDANTPKAEVEAALKPVWDGMSLEEKSEYEHDFGIFVAFKKNESNVSFLKTKSA